MLMTFRVAPPGRPDGQGVSVFRAERLADHRREYLTYEGPVSGGRGRVRRVAEGVCGVICEGERVEVTMGTRRWVGRRVPGGDGEIVEFLLHDPA